MSATNNTVSKDFYTDSEVHCERAHPLCNLWVSDSKPN